MNSVEVALKVIQLYSETHPRPPHVNIGQACQMLNLSRNKVNKLIASGALKLNKAGLIPVTEVDKVIASQQSH